jgi:hypothetical protein
MSKRKQKRKQARSVEVRLRFLGAHIEGFRSWLRRNGYRSTTIVELVRLFACWTEWLPARVRPRPRQYFGRIRCICAGLQGR